jgi:hypothetical protein
MDSVTKLISLDAAYNEGSSAEAQKKDRMVIRIRA